MKNALQDARLTLIQSSTNELSSALGLWDSRASAVGQVLNAINVVSVPREWADGEYRQAAMEGTMANMIAWQVRVNREERGMTQAQLGSLMGTKQSAISRLEDPEGGDVLLSTLAKAANAFDCTLLVRFVNFVELAAATHDVRPERLYVAPFSDVESSTRLAIDHGHSNT